MDTNNKGTILIIEDEARFQRIYHDVLTNDGYHVVEAGDGEKGWELTKARKPDLVLLDLVLPKLHGFEVLKKIRADQTTKGIPVIIFSVLGDQKDIQTGLGLGANDYTVKGFYSPREILNKIHELLAKSGMEGNSTAYKLFVAEGIGDAAKLESDTGLKRGFQCPHCGTSILLKLIPDHTHNEGHRFITHLVCPKCERSF